MSTAGGEVVFSFTGNASQLMTELKKIQTGTETTATEAVKSVGKIAPAADKATAGTAKLGESATKAAKAFGPLGGIIARMSPDVGALASSLAAATGAGEGFAASASAAGVSLGVVGGAFVLVAAQAAIVFGAYQSLTEEQDRNAVSAALLAAAHEKMEPLLAKQRDAAISLRVARGELTESEAAALRVGADAQATLTAALSATTDEVSRLRDVQGSFSGSVGDVADGVRDLVPWFNPLAAAVDGFTVSSSEAEAQISILSTGQADLAATAKGARVEIVAATKATMDAKAASAGAATATKNLADANALLAAESAAATAANTKYATVLDSIIAATDAATVAQLDDIAKVGAARDADIAKYKAQVAEAVQATAEGSSARETLESAAAEYVVARNAQAARDIAEIEKGRAKDSADIQKQITETAKEEADKRVEYDRRIADATLSSWSSMTGDIATLYYQQADAQAEAGSKGAKAAFRAGQAFAITQALVNGALAVTNVMATIPAPAWPVAIPAAVLATGVQIATIAAQKPPTVKHYGGAIYPDEAMMKTRSGEAVLTPQATQAMGGASGVAQYNRDAASGMQGGGGLTLRIGRLAFREGLRGDIRAGGVIEQAIDKRFSRTGIAPGQSGKLAVA